MEQSREQFHIPDRFKLFAFRNREAMSGLIPSFPCRVLGRADGDLERLRYGAEPFALRHRVGSAPDFTSKGVLNLVRNWC
jgi:hypothetical protein